MDRPTPPLPTPPTEQDEHDDAKRAAARRQSRFATWIVSLAIYGIILYMLTADLSRHLALGHALQTRGQQGTGLVIQSEAALPQSRSPRDSRGYRVSIETDQGRLEAFSPYRPQVGSQVAYVHLSEESYTRLIAPAHVGRSFVSVYLTSWRGLAQLSGAALLLVMVVVTLRRIILASMGKQAVV